MPDASAQHRPNPADYLHDHDLARTAAIEVRFRLAIGEDEAEAVRDVIAIYHPLYRDDPWIVWHPRTRVFLTATDAVELDLLIWTAANLQRPKTG